MEPAPLPRHLPPCACAQSSTIFSECFRAIAGRASMSANRMPRCTGKIARVLGVMAASAAPASMQ